MKKQFRDFESAREFVRKLNLKGQKEWSDYCISGNKPNDIPSNPNTTYKKEWIRTGDWLGTGTISTHQRVYRSFEEAGNFVRTLNLKNREEWRDYCKSGNKPDDIPTEPWNTYKKDYTRWGDFLGTGTISNRDKTYRSFEETREFVRSLGLKSAREWEKYSSSGNKPNDIHPTPSRKYKNKGWTTWGEFLGTDNIYSQNKEFRSFNEAREFAQSLGLKSSTGWEKYCKSGDKPDDIPSSPINNYKKDFKGWGDFLGTGNVKHGDETYLPWPEAKIEYQKLGKQYDLRNFSDWEKFAKKNKKLLKKLSLPQLPWNIYTKERVWKKMKKNRNNEARK